MCEIKLNTVEDVKKWFNTLKIGSKFGLMRGMLDRIKIRKFEHLDYIRLSNHYNYWNIENFIKEYHKGPRVYFYEEQ